MDTRTFMMCLQVPVLRLRISMGTLLSILLLIMAMPL